jgi:hypothetical protein
MGLAILLLAAALSLTATPIQNKPAGRDRDKDVKPSKELIAKVVEKQKALRSRAEVRHKESLARFEAARKAFVSKQQATLEEANRKTLERIKRGG